MPFALEDFDSNCGKNPISSAYIVSSFWVEVTFVSILGEEGITAAP